MDAQLIIRSRNRLPVQAGDKKDRVPVLRLQTGVLFPGCFLTIHVRRRESLRLLDDCVPSEREFIAAFSPFQAAADSAAPVHQVGVVAVVRDVEEHPDGSRQIVLEGLKRAVIDVILETEPYMTAAISYLQIPKRSDSSLKSLAHGVISTVAALTQLDPSYSPELLAVLNLNQDDPALLADRVAWTFHLPLPFKQEVLEAVNVKRRLDLIDDALKREVQRAMSLGDGRVQGSVAYQGIASPGTTSTGDAGSVLTTVPVESEVARIREQMKSLLHLPKQVIDRARIELDRLSRLPTASAEYGVTKNYLEWLLSLPWGKHSPLQREIPAAKRIISSEYFGPNAIKEHIYERLSVRKLAGGVDEGPTLCLVGAPGTGKASLAKAIATALNKEFIRITVGGISEVAEIKGTHRNFLGAFPGKIIRALKDTGSSDPVVLIEDIDYFNLDNDSSVNMALLEVIDTRFNDKFLDDYIGVPFDLSRVLFICSVRAFEEIPEQFVPRFEMLEIPGYIEKEKIAISKRHVIPKLLKKHGILKGEFRIAEKTLAKVISNYTQEAGLLGLSQQIEKIFRRIALQKAEGKKKSWTVNEKNLESFLGRAVFIPEKAESLPEIGTATGLAWTGAGGDLMFIEGLKMKGDGQIITTGSLGEVMKESIQAAHSYVRSKADMLGIDFSDFNDFDIHIHFPSGAIPKDGPSAGVTVCLVVASVMAERPIRNDIAMTGEVTLRGRVLPVGGIKEKISAAYRAGIHHVVVPKENYKDLKDLPREMLRKMKFTYIARVDELFEVCLMDFTPSSYTLEKIFAEEMESARKKPAAKSKKKPTKRRSPRGTGRAARDPHES